MIRDLVHGDWSWATLADALTRASITYRTGRAWSPEGLRREVVRASAPLRGYRRHGASGPAAPLPSHDTPDQPATLSAPPDALGPAGRNSNSGPLFHGHRVQTQRRLWRPQQFPGSKRFH